MDGGRFVWAEKEVWSERGDREGYGWMEEDVVGRGGGEGGVVWWEGGDGAGGVWMEEGSRG